MEIEGINAKKAQRETFLLEKSSRQEELRSIEFLLDKQRETLERIKEIVPEGVSYDDEMVAPEVKTAILETQRQINEAERQVADLRTQITRLDEQILPDEVMQTYDGLIGLREEIDQKLQEIASNPHYIDLAVEYAKSEERMREDIIRTALSKWVYGGTVNDSNLIEIRAKIVRDALEIFLTEDLAVKMNKKEDDNTKANEEKTIRAFFGPVNREEPEKRTFSMEEWYRGILMGMDIYQGDWNKIGLNQHTGVLVANLCGAWGTPSTTISLMRRDPNAHGERDYLRTINFVRSCEAGLGESIRMPSPFSNALREFSGEKVQNTIETYVPNNKPYYPKGDRATEEKLKEEYDENLEKTRKMAVDYWQKTLEKCSQPIEDIEKSLKELGNQIAIIKEARMKLDIEERNNPDTRYYGEFDFHSPNDALKQRKRDRDYNVEKIDRLRQEMAGLGLLAFGRKREIQQEIDRLSSRVATIDAEISGFEAKIRRISEVLELKRLTSGDFEVSSNRQKLENKLEEWKRLQATAKNALEKLQ